MTTPVLTATPISVTEETARHPLATLTGIGILTEMLAADTVWRDCTKPQWALLAEICAPTVEALLAVGQLPKEAMPYLPDDVRAATREALLRRGLILDNGQVTGKAVHAYYWQAWRERGEST